MIIVSHNTKDKDWDPIFREVEPVLDMLDTELEIDLVSFSYIPREEYRPGKWGINRTWLKAIAKNFIGDHERFLFHDPTFEVDGAYGWFNKSISKPFMTIKQAYRPLTTKSTRYDEFRFDVSRTIVHEILHSWAFTLGVPDETHDYQRNNNLMAYVEKIREEKKKQTQQKTIIQLATKYISLLKRALSRGDEEMLENSVDDYEISDEVELHHSASRRDATVADVIRWSNYKGMYPEGFYNTIIRQGRVHKIHTKNRRGREVICVVSQSDPTYHVVPYSPPTEKTLDVTMEYIGERSIVTHKELAAQGKATASRCPGILTELL